MLGGMRFFKHAASWIWTHLFYHSHPLCHLKESINLHTEAATFDQEGKNHSLALSLKTRREKKKTIKQGGRLWDSSPCYLSEKCGSGCFWVPSALWSLLPLLSNPSTTESDRAACSKRFFGRVRITQAQTLFLRLTAEKSKKQAEMCSASCSLLAHRDVNRAGLGLPTPRLNS